MVNLQESTIRSVHRSSVCAGEVMVLRQSDDHPHDVQLVIRDRLSQALEDRFEPLRAVGGELSQHACLILLGQRQELPDALRVKRWPARTAPGEVLHDGSPRHAEYRLDLGYGIAGGKEPVSGCTWSGSRRL